MKLSAQPPPVTLTVPSDVVETATASLATSPFSNAPLVATYAAIQPFFVSTKKSVWVHSA